MKISGELIKEYEGFKPYPYKCPGGFWSIGYGSRYYPSGAEVKEDDNSISREMADKMLNYHLVNFVFPVIEKMKLKNLRQSQIEALASLIYNIGSNAFMRSKLYKAIQKDDIETIFKEWNWIKAGGKVQRGLIKRRVEELDYFFNGY